MNIPIKTLRNRASAIILRDNKILLIHRWHSTRGEFFVTPGGGIKEGETPDATAIRELKEEAGVTISDLKLFFQSNPSTLYGAQHFFLATLTEDQEPIWQEKYKQTEENIYQFEWVKKEKIATIELLPYELRDKFARELSNL